MDINPYKHTKTHSLNVSGPQFVCFLVFSKMFVTSPAFFITTEVFSLSLRLPPQPFVASQQ